MAKKLIQDGHYSFSAAAKQVTLSDYTTVYLADIILITNVTKNIIIYNFADVTCAGTTVAGNVITLAFNTTTHSDTDKLQILYDDTSTARKGVEQITDWTAVAQNTLVKSATLDCSLHEISHLAIQAFLTTETAHLGTEFKVQVSSNTTGDEDWEDWTSLIGLIGTANSEAVTNNPLAQGGTSITCASTTGYTNGLTFAIKDATLVNSELCIASLVTTNTSITILDGVTNAHANTAVLYNIAMTSVVILGPSVMRARIIVNNTYSPTGSTLAYKIRCSKATSL